MSNLNRDSSIPDVELPDGNPWPSRDIARVDDLSGSGWSSSELSTPLQRSRLLNESHSPARSLSPSLTSLSDIDGLEHALGDLKTWVQEESKLSELAESLPAEILAQVGAMSCCKLTRRSYNMSLAEILSLQCLFPSPGAWQHSICFGRNQPSRPSRSSLISFASSRVRIRSCPMLPLSVGFRSMDSRSIFQTGFSAILKPARIWKGLRCQAQRIFLPRHSVQCSPTSRSW